MHIRSAYNCWTEDVRDVAELRQILAVVVTSMSTLAQSVVYLLFFISLIGFIGSIDSASAQQQPNVGAGAQWELYPLDELNLKLSQKSELMVIRAGSGQPAVSEFEVGIKWKVEGVDDDTFKIRQTIQRVKVVVKVDTETITFDSSQRQPANQTELMKELRAECDALLKSSLLVRLRRSGEIAVSYFSLDDESRLKALEESQYAPKPSAIGRFIKQLIVPLEADSQPDNHKDTEAHEHGDETGGLANSQPANVQFQKPWNVRTFEHPERRAASLVIAAEKRSEDSRFIDFDLAPKYEMDDWIEDGLKVSLIAQRGAGTARFDKRLGKQISGRLTQTVQFKFETADRSSVEQVQTALELVIN
ncbi:MAG TPA: hypothetical protein PKD64_02505 [Pirellulaceae bacterium]|nr:hypothetical protein [Pirellulaceae bacterium]HMO91040.1 hypothetical protein [Pirellulaceae bacterium]HMP68155.1 hypothetical protein [Pirellulaceae bacterium]